MALAPCRECGHDVSSSAPTCPQCGVKHPDATQAKRASTASYAMGLALAVVGVLLVMGLMTLVGV